MSDKEKYWHRTSESSLARYHAARNNYYDRIDYRLKVMLRNAKIRAKKKGIPFDIDFDYLKQLWDRKDGHCALTGRAFVLIKEEHGNIHPDCPSLDKINPLLGYVKGNVRLVTYQTNVCLHNFGLDELMKFAKDLLENNVEQN